MEFLSKDHVQFKFLKFVLIYTSCSGFYLQLIMNEMEYLCTGLKSYFLFC